MAASAEYELEKRVERLELFPVELEKGERPGQSTGHTGVFGGASLCSATLVGTHVLDFLTPAPTCLSWHSSSGPTASGVFSVLPRSDRWWIHLLSTVSVVLGSVGGKGR